MAITFSILHKTLYSTGVEIPCSYISKLISFQLILPTNSYQAILITDGTNSYAVYTYMCGEMEWGSSAVIGFNAAGNYFENHNSSGVPTVSGIACLALPEQVNNLVYDLVPEPKNFQCSSPPEPLSSLGEI